MEGDNGWSRVGVGVVWAVTEAVNVNAPTGGTVNAADG
jgi:hypothetical protein